MLIRKNQHETKVPAGRQLCKTKRADKIKSSVGATQFLKQICQNDILLLNNFPLIDFSFRIIKWDEFQEIHARREM